MKHVYKTHTLTVGDIVVGVAVIGDRRVLRLSYPLTYVGVDTRAAICVFNDAGGKCIGYDIGKYFFQVECDIEERTVDQVKVGDGIVDIHKKCQSILPETTSWPWVVQRVTAKLSNPSTTDYHVECESGAFSTFLPMLTPDKFFVRVVVCAPSKDDRFPHRCTYCGAPAWDSGFSIEHRDADAAKKCGVGR